MLLWRFGSNFINIYVVSCFDNVCWCRLRRFNNRGRRDQRCMLCHGADNKDLRLTGCLYIFYPHIWNGAAVKDITLIIRVYEQRMISCSWGEFLTFCNNAMVMYIISSFHWNPSNVCMIFSLYLMPSESLGCCKPCGFSKISLPIAFGYRHILDHYYWNIGNNTGFRRKSRTIMLDPCPMNYMLKNENN